MAATLAPFPGWQAHRHFPSRLHVAASVRDIERVHPRDRLRLTLRRDHQLRSEEHTSELQSRSDLVCRLLLEKKKHKNLMTLPAFTPTIPRRNMLRTILPMSLLPLTIGIET